MPRGGIRAGAGGTPAEQSQRKDRQAKRRAKGQVAVVDDGDWLTLPREGRTGNAPAWPLTKASARELVLWRRLWKMPQALGWERALALEQVASYARTLARMEQPDSAIGLTNLVRQFQDALGLTPAGLRMLRWRIAQDRGAVEVKPTVPQPPTPPGVSPKARLKVIAGGGAG